LNGSPAAVSIAGGATLAIESNAAALKAAMRLGELDFVVNTLDEALRTLKNEVRQHRPLSVGLIADVDSILNEMVERGVLPDLLLIGPNQSAQPLIQNRSIKALESEGMPVRLPVDPDDRLAAQSTLILPGIGHVEVYLPAANAVDLRAVDARLLTILPPDDLVRRRWIQRVPQYLRDARTGGRWMWLSEEERKNVDA
jgi:urocanate hydratase